MRKSEADLEVLEVETLSGDAWVDTMLSDLDPNDYSEGLIQKNCTDCSDLIPVNELTVIRIDGRKKYYCEWCFDPSEHVSDDEDDEPAPRVNRIVRSVPASAPITFTTTAVKPAVTKTATVATQSSSSLPSSSEATPSQIRQALRSWGVEVGARGRLGSEFLAEYDRLRQSN